MDVINRLTYSRALKEVIHACKENKSLLNDIKFIALLGSVNEREEIPGYSDLDILFIIKSDKHGSIKKETLFDFRNIGMLVSKRYQIKISLLTHTVHEFNTYVDYEYLKHYSRGRVFWGNKLEFLRLFKEILKKKKQTRRGLKHLMLNNILHARFNINRRFVSINKFNTRKASLSILKLFIDNVLEIADWRLIAKGIWGGSKKEIVSVFFKQVKGQHVHVPLMAYAIRKNWNTHKVSNEEVATFLYDCLYFIDECVYQLSN